MRKNFNSVQMLETSDVCNKFSKSVSYETLVGGTTTIGREHKQTRRLSKGSAVKPLTAVGTLTSLLCNSAKVMENLLHRHPERREGTNKNNTKDWILRLRLRMTIPVLALLFTIATISESRAECTATKNKWTNTCYEWIPGEADNCGDGCTYTYADGKLTVTATKPDAVVSNGMFSADYYESGARPRITDIEIDGEFESIGQHAFLVPSAKINGKDWVLLINGVGGNSFDSTIVTAETIIVSDGRTQFAGGGPWSRLWTDFNGTIILPPTITSIGEWTLANLSLGPDAKIYCGAENCEQLFNNVDCEAFGKKWGDYWGTKCQNKKERLFSSGKLMSYPDGCAKMWSTGCIKCKSASFKLNDGYCDRIRYTPAEAAKVLKNDDTNEITITFRN